MSKVGLVKSRKKRDLMSAQGTAGDLLWHRASRYSANYRDQHRYLLCSDDLPTSQISVRRRLHIATAGVGVVNVLMTVISIPLLDRVGRRPLLLASLGGMTLCLAALGLGFAVGGVALKWIGVLSLAVYIASFAIGLGPVFWLLISEIYPLSIRGQAASVATMANWLSNFLVSLTFLSLLNGLGSVSTFLLYAVLSLAGLWFCFRFVPETKGVPLERIEQDLRAGRPLRQLGKTP
jgi:MFS family permease